MRSFVLELRRSSPATTILIDEAYHEYVEDPTHATAIPLAAGTPNVIVSRTFSKVYGLAGLRVGYALGKPETIQALRRFRTFDSVNGPGAAAARASLALREHVEKQRRANHEARELTRRFFEEAGYRVFPSETNFLMVDIRRDPALFRDACRARGVAVGRPFPPLASCARISIGTADEMHGALEVFRQVLAARA